MTLFRLDSSIRVEGSVSREVADSLERSWIAHHPDDTRRLLGVPSRVDEVVLPQPVIREETASERDRVTRFTDFTNAACDARRGDLAARPKSGRNQVPSSSMISSCSPAFSLGSSRDGS